jgi:hypothetical protein
MARGEIHIQLAVTYGEDTKVRALARFGREARGCRDLYVQMVCYCKRNLTDGFVPAEELGVLVYPDSQKIGERDAARLIEVGLTEIAIGGYLIPGFLKRNKSKAEVDAVSEAKSAAGRRGGTRSGSVRRGEAPPKHSASDEDADSEASANHGASGSLNTEVIGHRSEVIVPPKPPQGGEPDPGTDVEPGAKPPRKPRGNQDYGYNADPDFIRFWQEYPKKSGKPEAFAAWLKALGRGANPELIIKAAGRYAADPMRSAAHTKNPQGWLNGERYADDDSADPNARERNYDF